MKSDSNHWNAIFSEKEDSELGWYETDASQTLKLLTSIPNLENSTIFLPGIGTSVLAEILISKGPKLILNDISCHALNRIKNKLNNTSDDIQWLCQNITQSIQNISNVDIWIDRAVLHFLTDNDDVEKYFNNVKSITSVRLN